MLSLRRKGEEEGKEPGVEGDGRRCQEEGRTGVVKKEESGPGRDGGEGEDRGKEES